MYLCSGYMASPQMSAGEKNDESIDGLSGVTFDHDVVSEHEDDESRMTDLEFGLCIPQDRLEDVDFSPKFDDDWIRLDDLAFEETASPHKDNNHDSVDSSSHKDNNHDSVKVVSDSHDNGEIESNVAANSFGEEQNSRENSCDFERKSLNLENSRDYAKEDEWKLPLLYKKPRGKKSRKENRNMTSFEVSRKRRGAGRAAVYSDSRERMKCTHCQAKDTPQWRLGPLGPNTLCNACGLRYKVGRLLENYRPAASPTFDIAKHSNFYKRLKR